MNFKLNYQLLPLLFLFIIGCSKKEDVKVDPPSVLIGKWKDMGVKGSISIDFMGKKATEPLDQVPNKELVEFKSDGTISDYTNATNDLKITKYKNTSTQVTFTGLQSNKTFDLVFNFKLNGSTLVLSMNKELFSKNAFALSAAGVDSDLADFSEFAPFITSITYEQTLVKQ